LVTAALLALDEAPYTDEFARHQHLVVEDAPELSMDLPILARHYEAAQRMADRWIETALLIIVDLGASKWRRMCDSVAETIEAHPDGISRSEISRIHQDLESRVLSDVLDRLEEQRRARRVLSGPTGGRRAEVWYPAAKRLHCRKGTSHQQA
jgi:hypothetical protein